MVNLRVGYRAVMRITAKDSYVSFRVPVMAIALTVVLGGVATLAGCTEGSDLSTIEAVTGPESAEACDDRIELTEDPPVAAQFDGLERGLGEGDIWFFASASGRWGNVVIHNGTDYQGKFPMWVGKDELPTVSVASTSGFTVEGSVSMNPTSEGLPGPLPSTVVFPSPGCWRLASGNAGI